MSDLLCLEPSGKWRPFTSCKIFYAWSLPASDDLSAVRSFIPGACQQVTTFFQLSDLLCLEPARRWRPFPTCLICCTWSLPASDDLYPDVSSFIPGTCQQVTTFPELLYLQCQHGKTFPQLSYLVHCIPKAFQQVTTFPQLSDLLFLEPTSKLRPFPSCQIFYTWSLPASDDLSSAVTSLEPGTCQHVTTFPQLSHL